MKKIYCPLYESFGSKINTINTSKISYQMLLINISYSVLNLLTVELKEELHDFVLSPVERERRVVT